MSIYRNFLHYLTIVLVFGATLLPNRAEAADPKKGQTLFLEKCASCHNNNMKDKSTGPALEGVQARWAKYPGDLQKWISNSQALVAANHPYGKPLYVQFGNAVMTSFPELSPADIDDILLYIDNKAAFGCYEQGKCETTPQAGAAADTAKSDAPKGTNYALWGLFALLLGGVGLLGRYINNLNRLAEQKLGEPVSAPRSVLQIILNPVVVRLTVFGLVIVGAYTLVTGAIGLGRQQGYAPEQPIKFSHALHAGKHKIDCQYCHDGARRSKHGSIPAVNTCINCHAAVRKGPETGTSEIIKIYAAAGFDPSAPSHETYYFADSVSPEKRLESFQNWLETTYAKDMDKPETQKMIASQMATAKAYLGKPIEWIRIHNLPDHAYFNHSQHVVAGGVACQTCHGEVEKMEVVKQHSPLSMGWCINCHRETKVKFDNNYYAEKSKNPADSASAYSSYEKYHKELKDNKRTGVSVEDIGGLECQKCHY
jgi:mono/diheme cytochrome c family protein